jgi:hypothetical protein
MTIIIGISYRYSNYIYLYKQVKPARHPALALPINYTICFYSVRNVSAGLDTAERIDR